MALGFHIEPQGKLGMNGNSINNMKNAVDVLRSILFDNRFFTIKQNGSGFFVTFSGKLAAEVDDKATFKCTQTAANKIYVSGGTVRHHSLGHWNGSATEVTLTGGADEWVYIEIIWGGGEALPPAITHSTSEPITDTSVIRIPLAKYALVSDNVYALVKTCHKYDVHLGNPLA